MTEPLTIPTPDVLQNRGFIAHFHKVTQDADGRWSRETDTDGNPVLEKGYLKFTNWTLSLIESSAPLGFGSLENWQDSFDKSQLRTVLHTLALMDDKTIAGVEDGATIEKPDTQYAAERLQDNAIITYMIALTNALLLAQGIPAPKVCDTAKSMLKEMQEAVEKEMTGAVQKALKKSVESESSTSNDEHSNESDETIQIGHNESVQSSEATPDGQSSDEALTSSGS